MNDTTANSEPDEFSFEDTNKVLGLVSSFIGPSSPSSRISKSSDDCPELRRKDTGTDKNYIEYDEISAVIETTKCKANIVIFSKDRPWQLQQLLKSMKLDTFHLNCNNHISTHYWELNIFIIVRINEEFKINYNKVKNEFESLLSTINESKKENDIDNSIIHITWLYEKSYQKEEGVNINKTEDNVGSENYGAFSCLLEYAVNHGENEIDVQRIMFLTDDCVFLEPLDYIIELAHGALSLSMSTLESCTYSAYGGGMIGFCCRLHPGVSWSQTGNKASPAPKSHFCYIPIFESDGIYVYDKEIGSNEWSYPFDLSGGIYDTRDIRQLLSFLHTTNYSDDEESTSKDGRSINNGIYQGDQESKKYSHPNLFEISGNEAMSGKRFNKRTAELSCEQKTIIAIPSRPLLVCLAINRVQDVYHAPLADGEEDIVKELVEENKPLLDTLNLKDYNISSLQKLLEEDIDLDLDRYRSLTFNSSHIGTVLLHKQSDHESRMNEEQFKLSVLIPVHSGPPYAATHSMRSILLQALVEQPKNDSVHFSLPRISPMQIVIVDDRCTDGSIDAMIHATTDILSLYRDVGVYINDYRRDSSSPLSGYHVGFTKNVIIYIDVIASPSAGIGAALNAGLLQCKSEFVARLDADDVSSKDRLDRQIRFLQESINSHVDIVGTHIAIFSDSLLEKNEAANISIDEVPVDTDRSNCNRTYDDKLKARILLPFTLSQVNVTSEIEKTEHQYNIIRCSNPPIDAGFVAWSLIFSCTVSHPSVMFRRSAVLDIGGYNESLHHAEDYDLWLRVVKNNPHTVLNLPFIGLFHRKLRLQSLNTNSKRQIQQAESKQLSKRAMTTILGVKDENMINDDVIQILKYPEETSLTTASDTIQAAKILLRLEKCFVQLHQDRLTNREIQLISSDCSERIGQLACIGIQKFGGSICELLQLWCLRCPTKQLEILSMLYHYSN